MLLSKRCTKGSVLTVQHTTSISQRTEICIPGEPIFIRKNGDKSKPLLGDKLKMKLTAEILLLLGERLYVNQIISPLATNYYTRKQIFVYVTFFDVFEPLKPKSSLCFT